MKWILLITAAGLSITAAGGALAQPQKIYRCGADGRELSQTPCGTAAPVQTLPNPSESERAAATARVKADRELADKMERDRLARESGEARAGAKAIGIHTRPTHDAGANAKSIDVPASAPVHSKPRPHRKPLPKSAS